MLTVPVDTDANSGTSVANEAVSDAARFSNLSTRRSTAVRASASLTLNASSSGGTGMCGGAAAGARRASSPRRPAASKNLPKSLSELSCKACCGRELPSVLAVGHDGFRDRVHAPQVRQRPTALQGSAPFVVRALRATASRLAPLRPLHGHLPLDSPREQICRWDAQTRCGNLVRLPATLSELVGQGGEVADAVGLAPPRHLRSASHTPCPPQRDAAAATSTEAACANA